MSKMKHGTYVGANDELKGKTALLRESDKDGTVLAQFDDVGQRKPDQIKGKRDVTDLEQLMFGWHEFPDDAFRVKATKGGRGSAKTPLQDGGPMHAQFLRGGSDG